MYRLVAPISYTERDIIPASLDTCVSERETIKECVDDLLRFLDKLAEFGCYDIMALSVSIMWVGANE